MNEIVVTPEGREAINVGKLTDDDGNEFVCLIFDRPNDSRAIVTFTIPLFHDLVEHMNNLSLDIKRNGF